MRIDCATCPARNRECDGCMMQVLFDPVTSAYGSDGDSAEIASAVDVFVATGMISDESARSAIAAVSAGHRAFEPDAQDWLRAV